jgi:hypothetical protein
MSSGKIIFFHIPKSGGTSIKKAFSKWNRVILDNYDFNDSNKTNYKMNVSYPQGTIGSSPPIVTFVHIHEWVPWSFFEKIHPTDHDFTFTILRHPISAFYSIYHHIKRNMSDFVQNDTEDQKNPLFINMISKSRDIKQYIDWVLDFGYLFRDNILPVGYYDRSFLRKMVYVGIFEKMDETIDKLNELLMSKGLIDTQLNKLHCNGGDYGRDLNYRKTELELFFKDEIEVYSQYTS